MFHVCSGLSDTDLGATRTPRGTSRTPTRRCSTTAGQFTFHICNPKLRPRHKVVPFRVPLTAPNRLQIAAIAGQMRQGVRVPKPQSGNPGRRCQGTNAVRLQNRLFPSAESGHGLEVCRTWPSLPLKQDNKFMKRRPGGTCVCLRKWLKHI